VTISNAVGRPELKYLRLGMNVENIENGVWSGEVVTAIQTNYATPLAGNLEYVGPSGEAHTGAVVSPNIQMRQLGWSRRTRPGFKRGWVPV